MKCSKCGTDNRPGQLACAKCRAALPTALVAQKDDEPTESFSIAGLREKLASPVAPPPAATKPGVPPRAWLHCEPLQPIPLVEGQDVKIGRDSARELVLPHSAVSRHHATISVKGQDIVFEDRGSANGSQVNGKRVTTATLRIGDVIQIGPYQIEIWAVRDLPEAGMTHTVPVPSAAMGSTSFQAKIGERRVKDVLLELESKKRTGTLSVADGQRRGNVVFFEGKPISASWSSLGGDAAVRALVQLELGALAFSPDIEAGETNLSGTVAEILAPKPPKGAPPKKK